jgi:hypothetical protein
VCSELGVFLATTNRVHDQCFEGQTKSNSTKRTVMSKITQTRFAHVLDAAWIIALWKAIHGGDPGPEQIALEAIAALSGTLTGQAGAAPSQKSFAELQSRLKEIGVELELRTKAGGKAALSTASFVANTYCIVFRGQRICITLPKHSVWPPAH